MREMPYFVTEMARLSRGRTGLNLQVMPRLGLELGDGDGEGTFEVIIPQSAGVVVTPQEQFLREKIEIPR